MTRVKIEVTAADIRAARKPEIDSLTECAVALAMRRATNKPWTVGIVTASYYESRDDKQDIISPAKVQTAIRNIVSTIKPVKPFSFFVKL